MSKENEIATTSFAIDSNGESRLLTDMEPVNSIALIDSHRLVPSTTAVYSLFSENNLFLDQD